MGQVRKLKLDKEYEEILNSRDIIEDALDLDKKLASIKDHLKDFEQEIHPFKDKNQKKVRDF